MDALPFHLPDNLIYRIQPRFDLALKSHFRHAEELCVELVLVNELGLSRKSDFAGWFHDAEKKVELRTRIIWRVGDEPGIDVEGGIGDLGADGRASLFVKVEGTPRAEFYLEFEAFCNGRWHESIVSLVLGPFFPSDDDSGSFDHGDDQPEDDPVSLYRPITLPSRTSGPFQSHSQSTELDHNLLLIEEDWGSGIPGKIWDSAIALSRLLPKLAEPDGIIVDLGAGTGILGLLMGFVWKRKVVITELESALDVPRANLASNSRVLAESAPNIRVVPLDWTRPADSGLAKHSVALCIASDLLYQVELFDPLRGTLKHLLKEDGQVVFGYKKRALSADEEASFWGGLEAAFERVDLQVPAVWEPFGIELRLYRHRPIIS